MCCDTRSLRSQPQRGDGPKRTLNYFYLTVISYGVTNRNQIGKIAMIWAPGPKICKQFEHPAYFPGSEQWIPCLLFRARCKDLRLSIWGTDTMRIFFRLHIPRSGIRDLGRPIVEVPCQPRVGCMSNARSERVVKISGTPMQSDEKRCMKGFGFPRSFPKARKITRLLPSWDIL